MDQASRSPAESRERAVSSEPCSTRPNPFDDRELSSIKRRRTSLSGASASRSRSVETVNSTQDSHTDAGPAAQEDTVMIIDSDSSAPHTPEPREAPSEPSSSEPKSSKVTLNLRNAHVPLETIPSSPISPTNAAETSGGVAQEEDVKASVEDSEAEMHPTGQTPAASASSGSETGSPPVEIIDIQPDEDEDLGEEHSRVTLLHDLQAGMLADPTPDFPYRDSQENLPESVLKLESFITAHDEVASRLRQYIENYLIWARSSDYFTVYSSYQQFRALWTTMPGLIWTSACRKVSTNRHPHLPEIIADLHCSFAKLTAWFVELDLKTIRQHALAQDTRHPDLVSPVYIQSLALLTQRDDMQLQNEYLGDSEWDDPVAVLRTFQNFGQIQGGTFMLLFQLTQSIASAIPRYPKLVDAFGGIALLAANFMNENYCKSQLHSSFAPASEQAKLRLSLGPQFYQTLSGALSTCIEKHVNYLTQDSTLKLVNGLTEILRLAIVLEHPLVMDSVAEHRRSHPTIASPSTAEVMAYDWRFTIFSKLIMSSQMQLRVMAVTQMCQDLVSLWKKYNENMHEPQNRAVLTYFSDFLQKTGLVTYILGPTCHPEITIESGNIIGFLLVTQTYTTELTDLMWQTVTTTQDPRVSDALVRMTARATNLWTYENMAYLCTKIQSLPVEAFSPTLRELCDAIFRQLLDKAFERSVSDNFPYFLCVRLIKEASAFGSPAAPVAHVDIQQFAMSRFGEMLKQHPPNADARKELYRSCIQDLADKVPYTLGSLWVITTLSRPFLARELQMLTAEYGLTKLLVDEMEHAISLGKDAGYPCVFSGQINTPRRDIWHGIILQHPSTITADLGPRLWNMLVGPGAGCQEDRFAAWHILNTSLKRTRVNPFLQMCSAEYLPDVPPDCFCPGTLEFVLEVLLPPLNEQDSIVLDEDDHPVHAAIEQLWRLILTAPEGTIEQRAIQALVRDVYVESRCIQSFPPHRARKVHLALVTRCLNQLSAAARKLKAFSDGTTSGDDEPMVIVATESQIHEQELLFVRSLAVIREFLKLHRTKAQFSTPDMRSLLLPSSNDVEGESAELKYQSFDGDKQTDVKPLSIGKLNTAGTLLASLRDATGFDNYRIYYKGQPFVPMERDICKSLEDLQIHNGLILVKRESDEIPSPARMRPGSSPVEIEILAHFEELWECLSMEEKLASEIYQFLVKLPLDEGILLAFQKVSTPYKDIFPVGQPFKSLYAIHALQEYLLSQFIKARSDADGSSEKTITAYSDALRRALSLIVAAISDHEVIGRGCSLDLQVFLSMKLVETLVKILTDPFRPDALAQYLDKPLLDRLLEILTFAITARPTESSTKLANATFQAIIESCSVQRDVWDEFRRHVGVGEVIRQLLLDDPRPVVRKNTLKLVGEKITFVESSSVVRPADFQEFFWPVVFDLIPMALERPKTCEETFGLVLTIYKSLRKASSSVLDIQNVLQCCSDWLLKYCTYEDITQPEVIDVAAFGLVRLIHCILCSDEHQVEPEIFPQREFVRRVFWRHLFPRWTPRMETLPKVILHNHTRTMLIDIVFALVEQDQYQMHWLLGELNKLVPYEDQEDDEPYSYELPQQFERSKAIRSSCGYVGLRNLSNTCYLNSLFTQLFMNIDFRRFLLNAEIRDPNYGQKLLFWTQSLFGFLQGSIRRFVDPTNCVGNIKTYDDTAIDIHNQMDVDEFYNLLFDRWEGQLLSSDAKRQLRSFYGGQLVQQVKSKECEHISERLEPFSAIQCDIKGKNTLQESLQAYVDGEVMEGDNKYKCSTCDRHVDAVKRACLKDIPDNLIFHLKRFDFNLRTLQRSKINDYFSFPTRIDMRPYTIEHLSNSAEGLTSDMFELVGVLVHSGTAESGHYYSYIRERPTANSNETWVEFNDDIVTSWDPAQMENSCFGGPDYRPPFDASGIVYEKNYSAYMLFYQRSSSLQREQDILVESKQPSPLHVAMPRPLATTILAENTSLLRRHCIYDPAHIRFVDLAVEQARALEKGICSLDHSMEDLAIEMALSHLDQVASRTKDVPDFRKLWSRIQEMCQDCGKCCVAVFEYFRRRPEVLRMLVQRNPEPFVRLESGYLFIRALEGIKENYPPVYSSPPRDRDEMEVASSQDLDVVHHTALIFKALWDGFHQALRSWTETFGLMLAFVKLGRAEMSAFLEQDYFRKLVFIIMADNNMELPAQYSRMLVAVSRRMTTRPPSYENIIALIDTLLTGMVIEYSDDGDLLLPEDCEARLDWMMPGEREPLYLTKQEHSCLLRVWGRDQAAIFIDKLIAINQNHSATDSIIASLLKRSRTADIKIFLTLRLGITGQITTHLIAPYLRVAVVYCRASRKVDNIQALITYVAEQCKTLQNGEGRAFFEFQRDVFDARRENSGESLEKVVLQGFDNLPAWAPGLLGFYDANVSCEVEVFLHEKLFKFGRSPVFADNQGGQERSKAMDLCARQLGVECLQYLGDNFVRRNAPVAAHLVCSLQRVVAQCQKYYNLEDGNADELDEDFIRLSQSVLQPLHRLTVEVVEDDGSDWENSSAGSDQMDSIGDLQTTGDLNDADI